MTALTFADYLRIIIPLALICVCVGVGVATEPRTRTDENAYGCTCCSRTFATVDGFKAHRCRCERVR